MGIDSQLLHSLHDSNRLSKEQVVQEHSTQKYTIVGICLAKSETAGTGFDSFFAQMIFKEGQPCVV